VFYDIILKQIFIIIDIIRYIFHLGYLLTPYKLILNEIIPKTVMKQYGTLKDDTIILENLQHKILK